MDQSALSTWLEQSFVDHKLENNEKVILRDAALSLPLESRRFARNRAFELVRTAVVEGHTNAIDALRWLEQVIKTLDGVEASPAITVVHFSPGNACRNAILDRLRQTRHSVDICIFTLSDDRIAAAVLAAHERGVIVRIITDNDKVNDEGSDMEYLQKKGVLVRYDRTPYHMHHKFAVFDKRLLLNGSFNWTRSASEQNEENVVLTSDSALLKAFSQQFDRLWEQFE